MDVMVYWSEDGPRSGAVDHYTSPYEQGWSAWRLEFCERARGKWGIRVVGLRTDGDGPGPHSSPGRRVGRRSEPEEDDEPLCYLDGLTVDAPDLDGYKEWLEWNVDAIQVDGYPWWQSARLSDEAALADAVMNGDLPSGPAVLGKHVRPASA